MKLWDKGYTINKKIENFTVGNDFLLDKKLVKYDCDASIAHAKMLQKINILKKDELKKIIKVLNEIKTLSKNNKFSINIEDEDCHTAIEKYLTKKLGNVGKKIHTCRSRNDQVLTAIRLYEKNELNNIIFLQEKLIQSINKKIKKYKELKIPGYTHMQKAMPTNVETWLGIFNDSGKDNIKLLKNCLTLIDKSPLGSAAGFGVPVFNIDKDYTAKLMGFSEVQDNPMYCQHSRGKFEANICNTINNIMFDLNKLSTDIIMFSTQEFGIIKLPKEFCTGSSIMPQKKNPDVLELIRAKYHVTLAEEMKIKSMIANLISGYNRDLQLTKEPVMKSIDNVKSCLKIITAVIDGLGFDKKKCKKVMTPELYATKEAYELVKEGMTFRDAYKKIGNKYLEGNK